MPRVGDVVIIADKPHIAEKWRKKSATVIEGLGNKIWNVNCEGTELLLFEDEFYVQYHTQYEEPKQTGIHKCELE